MNSHHTIVNLPSIPIPLASGAHSLVAAFGRAGLVDATDRFGVGVVRGHDLLAAVSELLFIPLDRFEKALQRPRTRITFQRDGFTILPL